MKLIKQEKERFVKKSIKYKNKKKNFQVMTIF